MTLALFWLAISLVSAFAYATVGVAVFRVSEAKPRELEGTNCSDCSGGTRKGRACYHWEHNGGNKRRWVAAFWPFAGLTLLVAKCAILLANGPLASGQAIAARFIGSDQSSLGLQERIAQLEREVLTDKSHQA